ncbi:MAG: efflux RND transporter periplasmic adaptor subunit [Woeseiaceae bacterium]|nr:efflux RND transporter periplasmic adaptor subunit [Woeseiaceae bacterium]
MPGFFRAAAALLLVLLASYAVAEVPVRVEPVADRPIVRQINVTGTVTSSRTAVLSTAVAGLVAELLVDEGYRVETGDVLVNLDAELAQLALERAVAGLQQQETALDDAKRRFAEAEQVAAQRSIARTQVESLRAEVASDEAAVVAAQAAVREQRAIVARHSLKAPFAGVISERFAELGEWVNPGDGLVELVETDNLRFDFRVGQEHFNSLSPQTPVEITLDAVSSEAIPGYIDTIVPVKNPGARTFLVRVLSDIAAAGQPLRVTPGMSVRGRLKVDTGRLGVAVSRDAILRFPDGRVTVWVVDTAGDFPVVHEQIVQTGSEFEGVVEITNGLESGDLVVVRGNETLQEDQAVSILEGNL